MAYKKGALTDEFRKRRRGLILGESLPIQLEYTHPYSGARLIFAKIQGKPRPVEGPYTVGWIEPGSECLWFYRHFETQRESIAFFQQQKNVGPPEHDHFRDDAQASDVYEWERRFRMQTQTLTVPQMETVVSKLSDIFNMQTPQVVYKPDPKHKVYGEAELKENRIIMRRPHLAILLHEFAHLVNDQINRDKWLWHGPAFVRTYLDILSLFPEIAANENLESLAKKTMEISERGDIPASQQLQIWKNYQGAAAPKIIPSDM